MEHQLLLLWLLALPAAAGPAAQPVASLFYGSLLALPVSPAALGAFEVGISVNDVEVQVTVPAGADADVVAKHVGAQHGLSADGTSVVARTILSRSAELSGKSLAYVLPVKIGGHHGTVHLPVYSGESHEDLAAGFIAKYGLQQTVARQLVGVMVSHEQAKATQGAAAPSSASPSPRTGSEAHDQGQLKAAADKAAQVAQAAALQKQAEEREQRERAAKEQQEREAAQELERAVKEQQEREAAQERVRVATERTEKEEAEKAARVKQQQMQEKVAKAKVEAFKAQQRAATGDNDMDSSEIDVQRLRREQKKQAVAGLDAKTKLDEQKKAESVLDAAEEEKSDVMEEAVPPQGQGSRDGKAKAALDAAEEEKLEMMEEVVSSQVEASGADRASAHSVAMADVGQTPHTEQPAKRRTDEIQTDKRDTVVRKANSRVVHEQLKRPLRNSHAGNEGDEYLLPHYTQEEAAKMQEEELRKRVAACTSLGCAVREHLQISRTTSLVVGIVAATVGACMLLDRYGIENTSCCRRSHSAEELRRIRQIDPYLAEAEALAAEEERIEKFGKQGARAVEHGGRRAAGEIACGICSSSAGAAAAAELELAAVDAALAAAHRNSPKVAAENIGAADESDESLSSGDDDERYGASRLDAAGRVEANPARLRLQTRLLAVRAARELKTPERN